MKKIAVYPGTFDPITLGHFDVITRALRLFDELIIAVAISQDKKPLFNLQKRVAMVKASVSYLDNVKVASFNNLSVEFVKEHNSHIIIRGLRAVSDFEYELQLGYVNHSLDNSIETVYLMPSLEHAFVSSSVIRNLLHFNSKVDHLIPKEILSMIQDN